MPVFSIHRRLAGVLVSLLLALGVTAAPAQLTTGADSAQTHARPTRA
jgi:hypothetical protein